MHWQLSTTPNGYPTINLDSPFEPFAEFLRAAHTGQSASHVLSTVDAVLEGIPMAVTIDQDYARLNLDHGKATARVLIDNLSAGTEDTAEMPLRAFQELAASWAAFVNGSTSL
jgi:hypothetical protein